MAKPLTPILLQEQDSFVHALLGARDLNTVSVIATRYLLELGLDQAQLVWNRAPGENAYAKTGSHLPNLKQLILLDLVRQRGAMVELPDDEATGTMQVGGAMQAGVLLGQAAGLWVALLCRYRPDHVQPEWREVLSPLMLRCQSLLHTQRLQIDVERLANAERLQTALFAISDIASSDQPTAEVLAGLHQIVGRLMYAENFAIVRYNADPETMRFMYFADSLDPAVPDPDEVILASSMSNSLTLAMLRKGQAIRGPSILLREQMSVQQDLTLGPDSEDWLGVPMLEDGEVRGAVVVQSYDPAVRYTEDDQILLSYVAQHIHSALSRRDAQAELERRVQQRTIELRREVQERQRSERLQRALFRIAEVSNSSVGMDAFYASVHEIVGELLDARNFYIALLTNNDTEIEFPYSVDERDSRLPRRKLGRGLSEYVLRTGRPLLTDRAKVDALEAVGEVQTTGTRSVCWLGVPLMMSNKVIGLIAVQSYTPDYYYTTNDEELLSFVSFHIANALERRQADESLRQAYADLEQRVAARTSELAHTNRELRDQISVRERVEFKLKHEALHDTLTGLPNRSQLLAKLGLSLAQFRQDQEQTFAVLFLDLDRFKIVNDSVGHLVGDELLKEAAQRISRCIRDPDMVSRLGGDEFAIVIDHIQSTDAVLHVAERVIRSLAEPMRIAGKELYTSASIGIALSHERYRNPEELLRDADVAMYRAKAAGRQRYALFDERLHEDALLQLELEGDLRRAVQRQEFVPFYQPIIRLSDNALIGFEALMRWQHPERGCLLPAEFLATAEESGILEQLDWQLYEQVCQDSHGLGAAGAYITINVSPRHLRANDFGERLMRMLEEHQVRPATIRLEVTEGALLENPDQVEVTLNQLRAAGVQTLLDDFGTGYSSLSYLHRFPLQGIKIDRSFVSALKSGESGGSAAIVRAIRLLADSLGLEVVAEGIETEEQRQQLRLLGLTMGQGFLFAQPASLAEVSERFLYGQANHAKAQ